MKKLTFLKSLLIPFMFFGFTNGIYGQLTDTYTYTTGDGTWVTEGSERIYQSANFTFLHKKNTSSSAIATTYAELRIYASHSMEVYPTVSGKIITKIEVTCSSSSYATAMSNATILAGTSSSTATSVTNIASVSGSVATFDLSGVNGCEYVKFTLSAQARTTSWKITYTTSSNPAATPTFSPAAGTYTSAQSVTISCATSGASIYYTTDGSDPDNTKTPYTGAISVSSTTTIKARAYASGYDPSAIASATYTINAAPTITVTEVTLPAFSATAGSNQEKSITVNGTNLTGNITLALSGTDAAAFSLSESSITPTAGSVTDEVIIITYAPTAPGSHSATLTLSSSGATDVTRNLTGTATLAKPVITAPSAAKTALTLNWNAVTGATSYEVNLYTKTVGAEMTDKESFDGITPDATGKLIESATYATGWSASSQSTTRQIYTTTGNFGTASPSFALTITGDFIQTNTYASPITSFSFWAKQQSGTTSSTLIEGYNGSTWVTIATLSNNDVSSTSGETKTYNLTALGFNNITQIKMTYTKVQGNLSIDDVTVTYGGSTITPVSGSPFTTTETSLLVSGLTAATTYYYTVTAKNGSYVSPASDEASASTLGTATPNVSVQGIFVRNGKVIVTAPAAGESIEIFNAVGQRLVSTLSTAGENEIAVPAKGILLVKAGSQVTKVMMP